MADQKLIEALRLLAERPDVLEAALALANGTSPGSAARVPAAPARTVREMWDEWAVWAELNISSWRVAKTGGHALERTRFKMPDGRDVTFFDLTWPECTPEIAEIYRAVRVKQANGRGGTISPPTIDREISNLQSMFTYFHSLLRKISHNPIAGWRRSDADEFARKTSLTPDQIRRFIEFGPPIFQDIVWTGYRCVGMRPTEARELRKSEIDWQQRVINLGQKRNKNRRHRIIPFPEDVAEILERHCRNSRGPYVFAKPTDPQRMQPVPEGSMHQWLKKCRERSKMVGFDGEAIVLHSLQRHSGVTQLVTDGAQESHIKRAAGMSDKTFRRYSQFNRPQQEQLRSVLNRSVEPPTPFMGALSDDRKGPSHLHAVKTDKASSHDG